MNTDPLRLVEGDRDEVVSFRRGDLLEVIGEYALPPWQVDGRWVGGDIDAAPLVQRLLARLRAIRHVPPKPGDRVTDGGLAGTLVRCPMCGDGLMHQPDIDELERLHALQGSETPRASLLDRLRGRDAGDG